MHEQHAHARIPSTHARHTRTHTTHTHTHRGVSFTPSFWRLRSQRKKNLYSQGSQSNYRFALYKAESLIHRVKNMQMVFIKWSHCPVICIVPLRRIIEAIYHVSCFCRQLSSNIAVMITECGFKQNRRVWRRRWGGGLLGGFTLEASCVAPCTNLTLFHTDCVKHRVPGPVNGRRVVACDVTL